MNGKYVNPEREAFDELLKRQIAEKNAKNFQLKAKTDGQQYYIETIEDCIITICNGPSGSGKTHIAMAKGIELLKGGKFKQVLLIRPLQECGRQLGYFPGDKDEKIANHMLAFMELFSSMLSKEETEEYRKEEKIVIETLEFLRGVTFKNTYIVIDEAQNCTYTQLKMILTRLGRGSKMVLVGDVTQTDLPEKFWYNNKIPLDAVMDKLAEQDDDIGVIELQEQDIVRHDLIAKICNLLR